MSKKDNLEQFKFDFYLHDKKKIRKNVHNGRKNVIRQTLKKTEKNSKSKKQEISAESKIIDMTAKINQIYGHHEISQRESSSTSSLKASLPVIGCQSDPPDRMKLSFILN